MESDKKITHYKHTKDYEKHIYNFNQENDRDVIQYFKYVQLSKIIDCPHMSHAEYLNYVMVKYGLQYHKILNKMKNKEKLEPIFISSSHLDNHCKYFLDNKNVLNYQENLGKTPYEFYTEKGEFVIDLYKYHKPFLLASYHMGYTHIPTIIEKTLETSIEYPLHESKRARFE